MPQGEVRGMNHASITSWKDDSCFNDAGQARIISHASMTKNRLEGLVMPQSLVRGMSYASNAS